MYALKNKVQLIGYLACRPEIQEMENGKKLARFSVATSETYVNGRGEKVKEILWHRVVAFGKVAEVANKYLDKGREVALEGKLVNRSYNDKDGHRKFVTEVQANEILMFGGRSW